jgi:hypothetical protein
VCGGGGSEARLLRPLSFYCAKAKGEVVRSKGPAAEEQEGARIFVPRQIFGILFGRVYIFISVALPWFEANVGRRQTRARETAAARSRLFITRTAVRRSYLPLPPPPPPLPPWHSRLSSPPSLSRFFLLCRCLLPILLRLIIILRLLPHLRLPRFFFFFFFLLVAFSRSFFAAGGGGELRSAPYCSLFLLRFSRLSLRPPATEKAHRQRGRGREGVSTTTTTTTTAATRYERRSTGYIAHGFFNPPGSTAQYSALLSSPSPSSLPSSRARFLSASLDITPTREGDPTPRRSREQPLVPEPPFCRVFPLRYSPTTLSLSLSLSLSRSRLNLCVRP